MSDVSSPFVLVVDDQPVVADTLVLVLTQASYHAVACYSASEAFSVARNRQPDILLCDVVLGTVSGIDVALSFRSRYPNCKVILISGNTATDAMLERAHLSGIDFPVLAKPIPPRELLAAIKQELARPADLLDR